jgi:3-oxo-5-alpha-steroid 4-dehydrogenase 1
VNGALVGAELAHGGAHLNDPSLFVVALGGALFLGGAALNVASDSTLRALRRGGPRKDARKHFIPRGGMFELVTCPHYLGECLEWAGFAIATRTVAGWAFAFWTFANLLPRAVAYRKWYRDKFGAAFPKRRRAMIPFAW